MSATNIEIRPVGSPRDVDAFWQAGMVAQGRDPNYSAPLMREYRIALTPRATPFARANDGLAWTAYRDGRLVGRIYAVKDNGHLAVHRDGAGHFGFLEAIDDDAVWDALFGSAEGFLRSAGLTSIGGPYSASINHECGLLVHGYDTPSTAHTNFAPRFYARQLERLGFRGVKDVFGYEGALADSRLSARVAAARARWPASADLTLRRPTTVAEVNALYNDGWAANWGAVPVPDDEAKFLAELTKDILKAEWTSIADWRGEAIGVLAMIPDFNEAIAGLNGRLAPFGWAKLLWRLKVKGLRRVRIPIIGVRRAYRSTRVGSMAAAILLADAIDKARAAGAERMEVSWMLEENRAVINLVAGLPAQHTKTWRLYEKAL